MQRGYWSFELKESSRISTLAYHDKASSDFSKCPEGLWMCVVGSAVSRTFAQLLGFLAVNIAGDCSLEISSTIHDLQVVFRGMDNAEGQKECNLSNQIR